MEHDPESGADLWDSEPIWVRLIDRGKTIWRGEIVESEVDADDLRSGDVITFAPDRIFDIQEFAPDGSPRPNRGRALFIRGKDILVGLTYMSADGTIQERQQLHGIIEVANNTRGVGIRVKGRDDLFTLPPDLRSILPARPGTYRLRASGLVVEDPTFVTTWTVQAPGPDAAVD